MKVCLISPPCESDVKRVLGVTSPPLLGLAYLASVLRGEHEVEIIDAIALNYSLADIRRLLEEKMPNVVGITSVTSTIYAYSVAKVVKEVNENCTVVVGGPHATFMARQVLAECLFVDVVVKGEGERTTKLLVEALSEGRSIKEIKGIQN